MGVSRVSVAAPLMRVPERTTIAAPSRVCAVLAKPAFTADGYEARLRSLRDEPAYVLPEKTRAAFAEATPKERAMIAFALDRLADVKAGRLRSSDYFIVTLREAARLAGKDAELFGELQGLIYVAGPGLYDLSRWVLGSGPMPAGMPIEQTFLKLSRDNTAAAGNNPNVVDYKPKESTITHHFGEFLRVGINSWRPLGNFAGWFMDKKDENPGDIRSSYSAVMFGRALASGTLTPSQAVDMIEWAFTDRAPGREPPPWGRSDTGTHLDTQDFDIDDWLAAYRRAFP